MKTTAADELRAARVAFRAGHSEQAEGIVASVAGRLDASTDPARRGKLAHLLASYFRDIGRAAECEDYARQAIEQEQQAGRVAQWANHLMFLSSVFREQGRLTEALELAEQGLVGYERCMGVHHRETTRVAKVVASIRNQLRNADP